MNDESYPEKKSSPLNLRGGQGVVKQNFSHGRSKSVVVETKRKKIILSKPHSLKTSQNKPELNNPKQNSSLSPDLERKRKALEAAKDDSSGAVLASDGFFPFSDTVELAYKYGISSIIQPGGSLRDSESIDMCNSKGISMVFTQKRHFLH